MAKKPKYQTLPEVVVQSKTKKKPQEDYVNYPWKHIDYLPEVTVNSKTKNKYKDLSNITVSSKKSSPMKQVTESTSVQTYNPIAKQTRSTSNSGQTKRQTKEATSSIKGDSLKNSVKELTAMTQFFPHPLISVPSTIINSGIGASDAEEAKQRGDDLNSGINSSGAMPWQYMIPGPVGKGLEAVSAAADLTDNFGLEEKKNGGWLDNYGEEANANEGTSSAPKGWMGEGYSNVGRDYSPAWGGQFAMGGSLPGSVGFTYARTNSPAPSEGPYAKKTMPSAQDGRAVADATYVKPPVILPTKTSTGPIEEREDFKPWWNWASKKAGDVDRRQDAYGKLGDLYAYYAGQPLRYNVLEHSKYKPTNAKNSKANYISINDPKFKQEVFDKYNEVFVNKGAENQTFPTEREKNRMKSTKINDNTYAVSGYTSLTDDEYEDVKKKGLDPIKVKGKKHVSNAVGRYFISKGKDEKGDYISYYDTFDEGSGPDGGGVGETLGLTKPFEIYDRIYLDPKTGKPKLENGGSMSYYQHGLDWKPKTISKKGSVIKDNNGYWNPDNWGEVVEIDSPYITMKGVNKPLLGISDTGDTQMMYPGQDYEFDGNKVTEFPIPTAQKRKRQPIYTDDARKVQAYNDSLALSNFSKLQHQLEPTLKNWMNPLASNKTQRNQGQFILEKAAQDLVNNNPNIDWELGRYSGTGAKFIKNSSKNPNIKKGYVMDQYYPEIWKDEIVPEYVDNQSPDITHKTIKPTGHWWGKGQNNEYAAPVQPYILQKQKPSSWKTLKTFTGTIENPKPEPTLKGKVAEVNKLTMGEPSQGMGIRERQMPNISAPNVEMSGPYMVGYHDFDTQEGIDRGFRSAEERDAFVEELRQRPAGNYQPSQMNISSYYDVNKRKKKAYGGLVKAQDGYEKQKDHPIDLRLSQFRSPGSFFTGYGFSQNPVPNVDVHGVGAYGEGDINDRLRISGNINSASVFYPGGNKMFMSPRVEAGVKYKFNKGGTLPKNVNQNEEGGWLSQYK